MGKEGWICVRVCFVVPLRAQKGLFVDCMLQIVTIILSRKTGEKYCTIDDDSYPYSTRTSYCEHGCCGTAADDDRRCCEDG